MWGALISGAAAIGSNIINNAYGAQREEQARRQNNYYNEIAAQAADARTRNLYNDLYSPAALLQQYRNAGLSPSLMFGESPGGQGQTGAQGEGASGIQPRVFGLDPMTFAQIENLKAQTEKTKAETQTETGENQRGEAEIENIIADTYGKKAATHYHEAAAALNEFQTELGQEGKQFTLRQMEYLANKLNWDSYISYFQSQENELNVIWKRETWDKEIAKLDAQVNNFIAQTTQLQALAKLNDEEREAIKTKLKQAWTDLAVDFFNARNNKTNIENQKTRWEQLHEEFKHKLKLEGEQWLGDKQTEIWQMCANYFLGLLNFTGSNMNALYSIGSTL